jgi:hypothetical protein
MFQKNSRSRRVPSGLPPEPDQVGPDCAPLSAARAAPQPWRAPRLVQDGGRAHCDQCDDPAVSWMVSLPF